MTTRRIRGFVTAATLLAAMGGTASAGHYNWTTSGPEPGRVQQIVGYASDPNRLYVVGGYLTGHLFRSDDRAQNWCYLATPYPSSYVVADPTNPDVLYAPAYPGVSKTTDGGASWNAASSGLSAGYTHLLVLAPSDPSVLYVSISPGGDAPDQLFRSEDGAVTWTLIVDNQSHIYSSLAVDAFDANTLYANTGAEYKKSGDGGSTWNPAGWGLPGSVKFFSDPIVPGRVWAASTNGVYRSTDGGVSFTPAQVGLEQQWIRDLAVDRGDPATIFAASQTSTDLSANAGLFVSHDSGASWDRVDLGISGPQSATAVAADPAGSPLVYTGAGLGVRGGLFTSADGGASWERSQKGLSGYPAYSIAPHPALPSAAFGFSGANFFGTLDSGASWAALPSPGYTVSSLLFDPTNASVLYGQYDGYHGDGTSQSGVYKSVNGGGSWTDASAGLSGTVGRGLAVGVSDPSILLASNEGGIWKSSNGGQSWDNLLVAPGRAVAIDPTDPSILHASVSNYPNASGFLRSADGGVSWNNPAGLPPYGYAWDLAIRPGHPAVIYALSSTSFFKSVDRGLSYVSSSDGLPATEEWSYFRLALDPSALETLYVSNGQGGGVFRTTDGAAHWRPLAMPIPAISTLDLAVSASGRDLYAATLDGIFQFSRSFLDVPDADPFWASIDAVAMNGVTVGCGGGNFCPSAPNTRAQVAPMLLRAIETAAYVPPLATGGVFSDVSATSFAAAWIEELARRGISSGCGSGSYCPGAPVTRAMLAVMLLKAKHGADYAPPPATGTVFSDVPADAFAAAWIEQLAAEGITAGCGGGHFCPGDAVLRAQAAALIVRTFDLS